MSQDAPISRKEKKASRDVERQKKGKKRKHAEVEQEDVADQKSEVEKDSLPEVGQPATVIKKGEDAPIDQEASSLGKRKRKAKDHGGAQDGEPAATPEQVADSTEAKPKKRRKTKAKTGEATATGEDGEEKSGAKAADQKSRFILFIGNLPYNTTDASLQIHFVKLMPFTLRHRTDPKTKKSKGFAFLEFENYDRMKTCLKLYHHSMFDPADEAHGGAGKGNGRGGRRINVELTAGGGGKADGRKEKIKVKNVRLEEQRKRRAELERKEKGKKERKQGAAGEDAGAKEVQPETGEDHNAGMHPSRLARIKKL